MQQYIIVLDYSNTFVKVFKINIPEDVFDDINFDMDSYLAEHYGYDESTCYYMCSATPINVELEEGAYYAD